MSDKPNVIVFFTDQQRWDAASEHGNPLELMPNFSRIAYRGTHLHNSFTCQPVCGPARSCWQTGQHATNTGVWHNGPSLKPDATTLADCFNDAGYHTGYIGKWHLCSESRTHVPAHDRGGYQSWLAANALEFTSTAYETRVWDNDDNPVDLPGYRVDALTDAMIRHIDERSKSDQPFMLFTSFIEPHFQNHEDDYPPPDGYREKYAGRWTPPDLAALPSFRDDEDAAVGGTAQRDLGGYWGMIKRLDEALGRVLDAMKSLRLLDNTIILFTTDHGCHFRTRNEEYKRSCHESSIRLPTAIQGPGFDGGGNRQELISLIDLPATLLDACGIDLPESFEGESFLPRLRGEGAWRDDMFVQISEAQIGRAIRTGRWKYSVRAVEGTENGVGGASAYREEFLYDLWCDPYELQNLIRCSSHDKVKEAMRQRLTRRMTEAGEAEPRIEPMENVHAHHRSVRDEHVWV